MAGQNPTRGGRRDERIGYEREKSENCEMHRLDAVRRGSNTVFNVVGAIKDLNPLQNMTRTHTCPRGN